MSPPVARLLAKPQRFTFDAAIRILGFVRRTPDPAEAARFGSPPGLGFPSAEVDRVAPGGLAGSPTNPGHGGPRPLLRADADPAPEGALLAAVIANSSVAANSAIAANQVGAANSAVTTNQVWPANQVGAANSAVAEAAESAASAGTAWSFSTSSAPSTTGLADPTHEPPQVTMTLIGLTGPSGVLPRQYSDAVVATLRGRSRALHGFLALISHRLVAAFAAAGIKYRLHRAADAGVLARDDRRAPQRSIDDAVLALTGFGTPHLADRVAPGADALRHYAGLFATHPRSADRLEALASDWLGRPVTVEQFVGSWLPLPIDQRTRLASGPHAGCFAGLGTEAVIGVRAWDQQARVVLRIGPLDRATFDALLPDRPLLRALVGLVRAFVGYEIGFAINPVLARAAMRPLQLRTDPPIDGRGDGASLNAAAQPLAGQPVPGQPVPGQPRLGWNSWIPAPEPARAGADAADAVFDAERVEEVAS